MLKISSIPFHKIYLSEFSVVAVADRRRSERKAWPLGGWPGGLAGGRSRKEAVGLL